MKLPEIKYKSAGGPASSIGPASAVAEFRQKQSIVEGIQKVASDFAQQTAEYEANSENSKYADSIAKFEMDMASKAVATPDEIRDWGLGDRVNLTTDDGRDREYIPRHEFYTLMLGDKMESLRDEGAANISSKQYRQAWVSSVNDKNNQMLSHAVKRASVDAAKFQQGRVVADFDEALRNNQFQTALDKLADPVFASDPELKGKLINQVGVSKENYRLNAFMRDASPAAMRAEAERMASDEYVASSPYDEDARTKQVNYLERMAKAKETEAKGIADQQKDQLRSSMWMNLNQKAMTGNLTAADLAGMDQLGFATPGDINAAFKMLKNQGDGGEPYSKFDHPDVYTKLNNLFIAGDAVAFGRELQKSIPYLSETTFRAMSNQQRELVKTPEYAEQVATDAQIMSDAFGVIGLDDKDESEAAASARMQLRKAFNAEVARQQMDGKRVLSSDEKITIADNLVKKQSVGGEPKWFGLPFTGSDPVNASAYDYIYSEVGEADYDQTIRDLTDALIQQGAPVTSDNILRLYQSIGK